VYCQLEVLRRSFPPMIRHALDDFPGSLDETYERVLLDIGVEKRQYAHRLFQCLAVSVRPLRVEELAEILAIQFDGALPTYNAHWRPENPQEAVLSACSSLIAVATVDGSSIVRFSHFSVKEFLTSERLSNTRENLSHFYIHPQTAHTTFAEAALSVLLGDHADRKGVLESPLAIYAAQQWVYHGKSGKVSPRMHNAMQYLFDRAKPHFSRWVSTFDIDRPFREPMSPPQLATLPLLPEVAPLYYATLCGFCSLVKHIVATFSFDINARGGYHSTSLHAAVTTGNVDIALLLLDHGAKVNTLDDEGWSPLHRASRCGRLDVLELLLEQQADVNIPGNDEQTPLYLASQDGKLEVARVLLRYGAAVDACNKNGRTPLIAASRLGYLALVRLLIQNGAAMDSQDNKGWTPLQSASYYGHLDIVRELVTCGADVNAQKHDLWNALHLATCARNFKIVQFLLTQSTAVDVKNSKTPLDLASGNGKFTKLLINYLADVKSRDNYNWTLLRTASRNGHLGFVRLLLKFLKDIHIPDENLGNPQALASRNGQLDVSRLLIERGADTNFSDDASWTSLHWASQYGYFDMMKLLLDNGAAVYVQQEMLWTLLNLASTDGHLKIAGLLAQKGADIVKLLLHLGAYVNLRNFNNMAPLDLLAAFSNDKLEVPRCPVKPVGGLDSPHGAGIVPVDHKSDNPRSNDVQPSLSSLWDINLPSMKRSFRCMSHHNLGISPKPSLARYNHYMMTVSIRMPVKLAGVPWLWHREKEWN